ncbi:hypothetical protein [Niallia sp. Krafla_26]|uniref:hypothetical protein n=1 Tax=Niallia sp. Krafla_26 TaxID=3064703 RepID=UPI003D1704E2
MKKVICVLGILIGVVFFFIGFEWLGIIVAVVALFFLPSKESTSTLDSYYHDEYYDGEREGSNNEATDSGDSGGGNDD